MDAPPTIKGKSGSSSPTSRKFRLSRKAWFFTALGIFIISTIFAFVQPPRRNPFDAKSFHGLRWFYHPIERNAFKRLSTITSSINDIFVVPETKRLWIAGDGGLLAYSDNGGVSWEQFDLKKVLPLSQEKGAKGAWRLTPGFISTAYAAVPPEQKSLDNEYYKKETAQTNANLDVQQKGLPPQQPPETYQTQQKILEESKDVRQEIQHQPDLNMVDFHGIYFVDSEFGWAVGEGGIILHTVDGGKMWNTRVLPYKKYPSPWYYLVLIVVVALLSQSVRRPSPVTEGSTIANMLISDKPLDASVPDAMDFHKIALGLSRFLRNENTQPPLTIAITGAWGTGKSSLMNLLKADLSRFGFRPVWFNVWHHQNEEHLLASLLENIRMQAIPPWWYLTGFIFRMKLLAIRGWRKWVRVLVIMLIFSGSLGYFIKEPSRFSNIGESIKELKVRTIDRWFEKNGDSPSRENGGEKPEEGSPITIFLTSVLSGMSLLYAGWRGFKAFGVNPANLMTTMVSGSRVKDLEAQAGFRHKFAMEFQDVTRALNPRTMLIIDDLDRCKPENVLVVLEAINFLVSSGDCFVVMGMDRDRVERCVGLGFKDVAEELIEDIEEKDRSCKEDTSNIQDTEKGTDKDGGRCRRADFAAHYLEKLINIEVPIPKPTPAQSKRLLLSNNTDEQERYQRYERVRNSYAFAGKYFVGLAMIGILVFTFWCGYHIERMDTTGNQTKVTAEIKAVAGVPDTEQTGQKAVSSQEAEKPEIKEKGRVRNPDMEKTSSLRYVWAALIFLPVGYWVFSRRSGIVIKDSDDFTKALDIWSKIIFMKNLTPRSVKRFINRVRYFAMCLRREEEGLTLWERFLYWRAGSGAEQKGKSASEMRREDEVAI